MFILTRERKQFKLEVRLTLLLGFLNGCLVSSGLCLLEQLLFELIVAHFEVWNQPVDDVLKSDISNNTLKGLPSKINLAGWALCSLLILAEERVNTPFAVSTHALVDRMSVSIDSLAKKTG